MTISITEDIRSITELKRNTNAVLDQIHKTKRPVILTVNGKAEAVIVDAKEYEKITNAFNLLDNKSLYEKMSKLHNPYGDGNASKRIVSFISNLEES